VDSIFRKVTPKGNEKSYIKLLKKGRDDGVEVEVIFSKVGKRP